MKNKISENFNQIITEYSKEKQNNFKESILVKKIDNQFTPNFKDFIREIFPESYNYQAKISVGTGVFIDQAWAAIRNTKYIPNFRHGLYIAFLFKSELNGMYLSLHQGYTHEEYENLVYRSEKLLEKIDSIPEGFQSKYSEGKITKHSIISKFYKTNEFTDEELKKDLLKLLDIYLKILPDYQQLIGNNYEIQPVKKAYYTENLEKTKKTPKGSIIVLAKNPETIEKIGLKTDTGMDWIIQEPFQLLYIQLKPGELKSVEWTKIIGHYCLTNPDYREKILKYLYYSFRNENTLEYYGKQDYNYQSYETEKILFQKNLDEINTLKNNKLIYHRVCRDLIATLPNTNLFYGYDNVLHKLKNLGYTENQLQTMARELINLYQSFKTNKNNKEEILTLFTEQKYKGLQSRAITPGLYLLNDNYKIINEEVLHASRFLSILCGIKVQIKPNLKNYLQSNQEYNRLINIVSENVPELTDYKLFNLFTHWLSNKKLGNYTGKDSKYLPIIIKIRG